MLGRARRRARRRSRSAAPTPARAACSALGAAAVGGDQASSLAPAGASPRVRPGHGHRERVAQLVARAARARRRPTPCASSAGHEPDQLVVARAQRGHERRCRRRRAPCAPPRRRSSSSSSERPSFAKRANTPLSRALLERRAAAHDRARAASGATTSRVTFSVPGAPSDEPDAGDADALERVLGVAGRRSDSASSHSTRTGRRLPSTPCRNGSGNAPTIAGTRIGGVPVAVVPLDAVARATARTRRAPTSDSTPLTKKNQSRCRSRRRPRARRSTARSGRRSGSRRRTPSAAGASRSRPRAGLGARAAPSSAWPKSRVTRSSAPPPAPRPRRGRSRRAASAAASSAASRLTAPSARSANERTRPAFVATSA